MIFKIAVLPGDGIGPEVSRQGVAVMRQVCQCAGHSVTFEHGLVGAAAIDAVGEPFPAETEKLCLDSDAILFSAVGDPKYDLDPNAKVRPEQGLLSMRKKLGLFANVRPVQSFKPLLNQSPLRLELIDGADFVCIRELTGGMYFGEKTETPDFASDVNSYSKAEVMRILRTAFEYARKRRRFLTVVDKANVLATGRLWRRTAQEMSAEYADVKVEYMYVDNAAMRIVQEPRHFDVLVTENTFGDILTDEASVISGSLGLLPSASIGEKTPLFEPIHGSFPQAKGRNIANPMAQILSVAMLFEYFGCQKEANAIRQAVEDALAENIRTPDIQAPGHAPCTTEQVGTWIAQHILEIGV